MVAASSTLIMTCVPYSNFTFVAVERITGPGVSLLAAAVRLMPLRPKTPGGTPKLIGGAWSAIELGRGELGSADVIGTGEPVAMTEVEGKLRAGVAVRLPIGVAGTEPPPGL